MHSITELQGLSTNSYITHHRTGFSFNKNCIPIYI